MSRPRPMGARKSGGGDTDISAVGALVADPARCRILLALDDGRALSAGHLAWEAGVSAATASAHLRKLTEAGLLTVEAHGRHRYYRLSGPEVAELIEALQRLAPVAPISSLRQDTKARALREARTCYDHVAGRLGVEVMRSMIDQGHLSGGNGRHDPQTARTDGRTGYGHDIDYVLTGAGTVFLAGFGATIPADRRLVRYCVDWSEQRHHLAGAVGRGILDRMLQLGWLRRVEGSRVVRVTADGRQGLHDTFGLPPAG